MRVGNLVRDKDVSGISGTGVLAELVEFSDGTTVLRWRGSEGPAGPILPTIAVHPSVANVETIHGHNGATQIVWHST